MKRLLPALLAAALALPLPAAAEKTLRMFITSSESSLDPAVASDLGTLSLVENLFDPLLRYDYLARPVRLAPNTVTALPEVSADGLHYTLRLRPGILFTPDPAFGSQAREVTAADYVYAIKRLYNPALKSPWLFLFDGKLAGDAAFKKDYRPDAPLPGLQALDRYTLRFSLNAPDPNFLYYLATPAAAVVAREVVEAYGSQVGNHPIGTGPFILGEWKRSSKITLLANPLSRHVFPAKPDVSDAQDQAIASALAGQRLPRVDKVEVRVAEEFQGRMLGFLGGEYDYLEQVPESMTDMVLANGALKPALAKRGIALSKFPTLQTYYMWMNMQDPVIGGMDKTKVALRRAIALSYNSAEDIALLKKGLALPAQSPLPPGMIGYDPAYRSPLRYDPALARALLDQFGYRKCTPEGLRCDPQGKPLSLVMHSEASVVGRLRDEMWRKSLNAIGLRVVFKSDKKGEIIKASRLGKVMMFETNWLADFPDADNYYQLLYGANAGRANYARFDQPDYNRLYEAARALPDPAARLPLYTQMNDLLHAYNPWVLLTHPISADLRQPWLKNYKRHPVEFTTWRYLDLDLAQRNQTTRMNP